MKKTYRVYQVDSFTKERFTGNPAGVVTNADGMPEQVMQKVARELNNSETAFLFSDSEDKCDIHVRFFTPTKEVPICGHATIAAHYVRAVEMSLGSTRVLQKTGAGILPVDIERNGDDYRIIMTQGEIFIGEPLRKEYQDRILKALGIPVDQASPDCPIAIASTGHSKVMIGIKDNRLLHGLKPDLTGLSAISALIGCNGFYVFTLNYGENPLIHGRMFAPAIGIAEDPVTGNANGPLGAYLVHYGLAGRQESVFSFEAVQGEAIGRTGKMQVSVKIINGKPEEVKIAGDAVIAFVSQIHIES